MTDVDVHEESIVKTIHDLLYKCGGVAESFTLDLATQMIQTTLKLVADNHDPGQMKLISRALKEMRYAYRIFNQYPDVRCVSIFGSARTPEKHPDYIAAQNFGMLMAKSQWMCITGAAAGIMHAGITGAQKKSSFGLSISLPWETPDTSPMHGDPKHMIFRYFFTRKLMFLSHADAVAAFPGGYGTLDELFEVLTLMQTGKSNIIPLVLVEGKEGGYWEHWKHYMESQLVINRWICPEDQRLYYIASSSADAKRNIMKFYKNYHSSRYVKDLLAIRLQKPLKPHQIDELNDTFVPLIASGKIYMGEALPGEEGQFAELPRLLFNHNRKNFGLLRIMIDHINNFKL